MPSEILVKNIYIYLPGVMKTGLLKHFGNFSQLPLSNSLFTVSFAYVVFLLVLWLGICVEVDEDRITILLSIELLSLLTI